MKNTPSPPMLGKGPFLRGQVYTAPLGLERGSLLQGVSCSLGTAKKFTAVLYSRPPGINPLYSASGGKPRLILSVQLSTHGRASALSFVALTELPSS